MPQLDFSWTASQLFWLTASFVFLYVALARWVAPTMELVLEKRARRKEEDLSQAEAARAQAEIIAKQYQAMLGEGKARAQALAQEAASSASAALAKRIAELGEVLKSQEKEAEARIAKTKAASLEELVAISANLAREITAKLVHVQIPQQKAIVAAKNALES